MRFCFIFFAILFFCLFVEASFSQEVKLNNLVPPSPEVSALGKFGLMPVDHFTGIANISIPIYKIQEGIISFPISVNYHPSGIKVKEESSEIGLGWALAASGTIVSVTRGGNDFVGGFRQFYQSVPDCPDSTMNFKSPYSSYLNRYYLWKNENENHPFLSVDNPCGFLGMITGLKLSKNGVLTEYINQFNFSRDPFNGEGPDFASDLYIITIGDRTYKFVFDNSFKPVVLGDGALKIEFINDIGTYPDWKVTDEMGIEYYFTERQFFYSSTSEINDQSGVGSQDLNTWHLTKIKSPTYGEILFKYIHNVTEYEKPLPTLSETYLIGNVTPFTQQEVDKVTTTYSIYQKVNIDSIIFSTGFVKFVYAEDRLDLTGAKRLQSIDIKNSLNELIKKFEFDNNAYFNASISPGGDGNQTFKNVINRIKNNNSNYNNNATKRLKLVGVKQVDPISTGKEMKWSFIYNESLNLPPKLCLAVDHWGYFNGAANSQLVPPVTTYFNSLSPQVFSGADRNANPTYMQANVLTKMVYPTGGSSEFFYQTNQYKQIVTETSYQNEISQMFKAAGSSVINVSSFIDSNGNFTVAAGSNRVGKKLKITSRVNAPSAESYDFLNLVLRKNGQVVKTISHLPNYGDFELLIDSTYILDVGNYNLTYEAATSSFYNASEIRNETVILRVTEITQQVEKTFYHGGLRIQQVKSLDPVTGGASTKDYKYFNMTLDGIPIYESAEGSSLIGCPTGSMTTSNHMYRYGSSLYNFMDASNSPYLGYEKVQVFEIDDGNKDNGMTEYTYFLGGSFNANQFIKNIDMEISNPIFSTIPRVPSGYRGKIAEEIHKRSVNGASFIPVASKKYYYSIENGTTFWQMIFDQGQGNLAGTYFRQYNVYAHQFAIPVHRNMLTKVENYSYDEIGNPTLKTLESFEYDKISGHYQLIKKTSTTSTDEPKATYYKYPDDFGDLSVQSGLDLNSEGIKKLQSSHVITPVEIYTGTESIVGDDTVRRFTSGVVYSFNTSSPTPKSILSLNVSSPLTDFTSSDISNGSFTKNINYKNRINFTKYDTEGRLIEQAHESGFLYSYMWGYNKMYVIAEAQNASADQIAFTSFEDSENGNWVAAGLRIMDSSAPTGKSCLELGSLQKGGLTPSKFYTLSYWFKSGASVTVSGGTKSDIVTTQGSNGWSRVSMKITGSSVVTISGNGFIDEVCLYPVDAQMTTYTYTPGIGLTSITDTNNVITYYRYDGFGRLSTIADANGNIVKQFDYSYREK